MAEPGLPESQRRAPDNLVERRTAEFDHMPDEQEVREAFARDRDRFGEDFEEKERIGTKIVLDERWKTIGRTPGWQGNGERWWERDSHSTHSLSGFDLERGYVLTDLDGLWSAAKDFGPSIAASRAAVRKMADEKGIDLAHSDDIKIVRRADRHRRSTRSDRSL